MKNIYVSPELEIIAFELKTNVLTGSTYQENSKLQDVSSNNQWGGDDDFDPFA